MELKALQEKIEKAFSGIQLKPVRESLLLVDSGDLVKVVKMLKEDADLKLDYLSSVTGADYLKFLECVYHFYSMEKKGAGVVLRVRTGREQPVVPSLVPLYRGAEFQEREVYDMFGIEFSGHPDMRRIFMWEGFEGFPLRKDYVQEDSETLEEEDVKWLESRGVEVTPALRRQAEQMKKEGRRATAQPPSEGQGKTP